VRLPHFQPAFSIVEAVFLKTALPSPPRLFPVNQRQEALVAPDHLGLQTFPAASGQDFKKALGFSDDFRRKAIRSQALQGELNPGRILPDQDLQPVMQVLQEGHGGQGRVPRQPKLHQQQQDQAGKNAGKAGSGFQKPGLLTVGL
jgi:hypothetical protein